VKKQSGHGTSTFNGSSLTEAVFSMDNRFTHKQPTLTLKILTQMLKRGNNCREKKHVYLLKIVHASLQKHHWLFPYVVHERSKGTLSLLCWLNLCEHQRFFYWHHVAIW
jgi:hypothetical protein